MSKRTAGTTIMNLSSFVIELEGENWQTLSREGEYIVVELDDYNIL